MSHVVVTGTRVPEHYLNAMRECGLDVANPTGHLAGDALVATLRGADGYLLGGGEIATRDVLLRARDLRLLAFLGTGYGAFVDADAATELGIAVTTTPGANTTSVAELAICHVLNLRRRAIELSNATKHGRFPRTMTSDLSGSIVGIIGMGAIGAAIARILVNGFGVHVIYHSHEPKPAVEDELRAIKVPLAPLLAASDIVVVAAATTKDAGGFIGAEELARMRPDSLLVNIASASLVDGHALFRALSDDVIAAAAFDGYYEEPVPPPDADAYGLLSLPDSKFVLTPRTGALTDAANDRMCATAVSSVCSFFATGDDDLIVNPEYRAHRRARELPVRPGPNRARPKSRW